MAIPKQMRLEFVTLERPVVQDDVDEVVLPGELGDFGVLPGHAPLLAALRVGTMWYRKGNERRYAFVDGGFAEVVQDRVSVLARVGEHAEDIDVAHAEESKRRAEAQLAKAGADADVDAARAALQRAVARLEAARHSRARV